MKLGGLLRGVLGFGNAPLAPAPTPVETPPEPPSANSDVLTREQQRAAEFEVYQRFHKGAERSPLLTTNPALQAAIAAALGKDKLATVMAVTDADGATYLGPRPNRLGSRDGVFYGHPGDPDRKVYAPTMPGGSGEVVVTVREPGVQRMTVLTRNGNKLAPTQSLVIMHSVV